jgi:hypothetical protein
VSKAAKTEFRRMKSKRFLKNSFIFDRIRQANWKMYLTVLKAKINQIRSFQFWPKTSEDYETTD